MNNKKRLTIAMSSAQLGWGWAYFMFYLVLAAPLLGWIFDLLGWDHSSAAGSARLNAVFFIMNFLASFLIFRTFLLRNLTQVGKRFWGFVQAVILGLVMYYVGNLLMERLLELFMPHFRNLNDSSLLRMAHASRWLMILGTVLLAPFTEECFMRGLVFGFLMKKNRIAAYAMSTLLFALIHVVGYFGQAPVSILIGCFLQYLPAGIALGWAYEKADSIFAPILMHCMINAYSMGYLM